MFKVERCGQGYRVYLGDGKRGGYTANSEKEVAIALKHNIGDGGCKMGGNADCPLCRAINREAEAMRNGRSWVTA